MNAKGTFQKCYLKTDSTKIRIALICIDADKISPKLILSQRTRFA
jgi:hypothetical protein